MIGAGGKKSLFYQHYSIKWTNNQRRMFRARFHCMDYVCVKFHVWSTRKRAFRNSTHWETHNSQTSGLRDLVGQEGFKNSKQRRRHMQLCFALLAEKMEIMADYLSPNAVISEEEQRQLFQIISRVNPLNSNKRWSTRKLDGVGPIDNTN